MSDFLEALLSIPTVFNGKVSPDSQLCAFTWYRVHEELDVFVVPTDGSTAPVALTHTSETTMLVDWASNSQSIIISQDKDRNERNQLYRVKITTPLEMNPLTDPDPPYFLRGGALHPNDRYLCYSANYDFEKEIAIEPSWIYRHDLLTDERVVIAKPKKSMYTFPQISSTGTHVLYRRKDLNPAGEQVWLVGIDGTDDREILNFGSSIKVAASWVPNGRHILFITEVKNGSQNLYRKIGLFDIHSEETIWLIDDPARNLEVIHTPVNNSEFAVLTEVQRAKNISSILNLTTFEELRLPRISGSLLPCAPVKDETWLGIYYSSTQPSDLVLFDTDNCNPTQFNSLTHVWERTTVKPDQLTPAEDFCWQSKDDREIHGWLYRSKNPSDRVILFIHGGPTAHSEDFINPQIQYFCAMGFHVLDPNYRGSTGYGLEFQELIKQDGWGGLEQWDIALGAEALVKTNIVTPAKIGITGTSYGGYSSWFAITKFPHIFGAAAPICGMTDLVVDYETTRPDLRQCSEEMLGGSPQDIPGRYFERSPINFVNQIVGAVLIIQGSKDPNVTPANLETVERALQEKEIKYKKKVFDNEGHGIIRPANQRILFRLLADFFNRHLK